LRIGGAVELGGLTRPPNFARSKAMLEKVRGGEDPAAIAASWIADEAKWRATRAKYLLY